MSMEFVKAIVGSLLRWALAGLAGYLVREGALTGGQIDILLGAAAAGLVSLFWAIYQKYRVKLLIALALELPQNTAPAELRYLATRPAASRQRVLRCLLAFFVLLAALPSAACRQSSLQWAKDRSGDVAAALAGAPALVDSFAARNLVTAEEAQQRKASIARLAAAYAPLDAQLQQLERFDARAALDLLPHAEQFVRALAAEKVLPLPKNPVVARRYAEARAILDAFGAGLLARLNSKARGARASSGFSDWREMRLVNSDCERLSRLLTTNG